MTGNAARTRFRVWVFLVVSAIIALAAIAAIGDKSGLFESEATLHTQFAYLDGLAAGAPVRLSGLTIGSVTEVEFPPTLSDSEAQVTMSIKARYLPRLRQDSRAVLGSKGLLGDKLIDLTVGSADAPPLADGDIVQAQTTQSLNDLTSNFAGAAAAIERAASRAETAIDSIVNERMSADTQRAMAALAQLLEAANDHPGVLHTLVYDEQAGQQLKESITEVTTAAGEARTAVARVDRLLAKLERGPGAAHDLLYGEQGQQIARNLSSASADVQAVTAQLRTEDGLVQRLLVGEESKQLATDLLAAGRDLREIMSTIEQGDGSLGGLVMDPTVYEDLKSTLGNIERNVLLKALMRFAIADGDLRRPALAPQAVDADEASTAAEQTEAP